MNNILINSGSKSGDFAQRGKNSPNQTKKDIQSNLTKIKQLETKLNKNREDIKNNDSNVSKIENSIKKIDDVIKPIK